MPITIDLSNPTKKENYLNRTPIIGLPVSITAETSGTLIGIALKYYANTANENELDILIRYLQYFIHAPCWLETVPFDIPADRLSEIQALRALSLTLKTAQDIQAFTQRLLNYGLDPL